MIKYNWSIVIGDNVMFKLLTKDNRARGGEFTTVHGTVQTPVFMNVGTSATVKGGISALDL